jgi:CheY-like chemotaxis protein
MTRERRPAAPSAPASVESKRKGRVLVVDDDPDSAETLAELVRLWKYEVRISFDGRSALAEARKFQPDVILLDIGLPGQDGYETARRIREQGLVRGMLIALTGYGQDEDRRRALDAGFDRHLTKPVSPDLLQQVLAGGR